MKTQKIIILHYCRNPTNAKRFCLTPQLNLNEKNNFKFDTESHPLHPKSFILKVKKYRLLLG